MKIETVMYAAGGLFAIATIIYFSWEYLISIPRIIKATLLFGLIILFAALSRYFGGRGI